MPAAPIGSGAFACDWPRVRVVFGVDAVGRLRDEMAGIGVARPLVVTTRGRASGFSELLADLQIRAAGVCDRAALHVPIDAVRAAVADADRRAPDALLAFGGGSAIGLAKAVARERPLPIVAVPTTYSGSEMTPIWGVTGEDAKRTGRDPVVAPRLVIYDPRLTLELPARVSAASGMNAMAHAVEAMYAPDAGPIAWAAAEQAVGVLAAALPRVVSQPADLEARGLALGGAHAAGFALGQTSMGLHHKICHVLGGSFGLPHALTHAVVLPMVVRFNAPAVPEVMARVAAALGADDAAEGLRTFNRRLNLPESLVELGFRPADAERAAELVTAASYPNPRPVTAAAVAALLRRAAGDSRNLFD